MAQNSTGSPHGGKARLFDAFTAYLPNCSRSRSARRRASSGGTATSVLICRRRSRTCACQSGIRSHPRPPSVGGFCKPVLQSSSCIVAFALK
eukprot:240516-Pyramimonas_sp.AAC.1